MKTFLLLGEGTAPRRAAARHASRSRSVALVALLTATLVLSWAGLARAAPFDAATPMVFVAQGDPTQLEAAVQANGQVVFQNVGGPAGLGYNAISYNTADNYIYGVVSSGPDVGRVVRVEADGSTTVTGIAVTAFSQNIVNLGAFGPNGLLYIGRSGSVSVADASRLQVVDVVRGTTSVLNLSQPLNWSAADLAYADGYLWAASGAENLI